MKKKGKIRIRHLINLEEKDGLKKTIERLQKRYKYLYSRNKHLNKEESRQMKYIRYHMKKYQKMYAEGIR